MTPLGTGKAAGVPEFTNGWNLVGNLKGRAVAGTLGATTSSTTTLSDGRPHWTMVHVPVAATLLGVLCDLTTNGNYTGDNNNQVGLYSVSGTTLTKVAESTNNANLWQPGAAALLTIPFASSYPAAPGIYYVAFLYNSSAQVTAPVLRSLSFTDANAPSFGMTNGHLSVGLNAASSISSLPSPSAAVSTITGNSTAPMAGVYG